MLKTKLQYYIIVPMFVLFSIAVSFIKNCSFHSYKFIRVDTASSKLTTLVGHFPANKCSSPGHFERLDESNVHEIAVTT